MQLVNQKEGSAKPELPQMIQGRAGTEGSATAKNVELPADRVTPGEAGKSVDEQG